MRPDAHSVFQFGKDGQLRVLIRAALAAILLCTPFSVEAASSFAGFMTATSGGGGGGIPPITAGTSQPYMSPNDTADVINTSWAPQAVPGQQGTSGQTGFNSNVIANWDMVPNTLQSGTFHACIMAVSLSDAVAATPGSSVTFYLDGGSPVVVSSFNSTKTFTASGLSAAEYCVSVNTTTLVDGVHEMRAIVTPTAGYPRYLSAQRTATATSGSSQIALQAHGWSVGKIVYVTSSLTGLPTGRYCVMQSSHLDPGHFDLSAYTPAAGNFSALPIWNLVGTQCATTATTPTQNGTFTIAADGAGNYEPQPVLGGSYFFSTNANSTLLPSSGTMAYADANSGSGSICSSASPCATYIAAVASLYPVNDGNTCAFTASSPTITGCGSYSLNQAVFIPYTESPPSPWKVDRPYWVKTSSSGTITLCLEPVGSGCTAQSTGGSGGSAIIDNDYSHFTVYLKCSGTCPGTPEAYQLRIPANSVSPPETFGWFNILPNPGTATSSVPFTSFLINYSPVWRLHVGVDVHDVYSGNQSSYNGSVPFMDRWTDSINYSGGCTDCYGYQLGYGLGRGSLGWELLTSLNISTLYSGVLGSQLTENNIANSTFGCWGGFQSLMIGNTCTTTSGFPGVTVSGAANSGGNTTITVTGSLPSFVSATAVGIGWWSIAQAPVAANSYPQSNCLGASTLTVGSITSNTFTLIGQTPTACSNGDYIGLNFYYHQSVTFTQVTAGGNFASGGTAQGPANAIFGFNTYTGNTFGPGFFTQDTSFTGNYKYFDIAYINNNFTPANATNCTSGTLMTCMWGQEPNGTQFGLTGTTLLIDGNTFGNGSISGNGAPYTYTYAVFRNNTCNGTANGAFTAGLATLGWGTGGGTNTSC
jgi:hypothetical protein